MPVFVLSIHAGYACRHAGACCTAGWRIPVEHACEQRLTASGWAAAPRPGGRTALERDGALTLLTLAPDGTCVFFDRGSRAGHCAVHGGLGRDALPSACQHFPRLPLTDDLGTFVTLSHFCPTAAAMLFRNDVALSIVEAPAAFHSVREYEGLDARGVLPPLLRPGMLMDLEAHHAWQRKVVQVLGEADRTAESALAQIAAEAEIVRGWRPGGRSLADCIGACSPELPYPAAGLLPRAVQPCKDADAATETVVPVRSEATLYELARASLLDGLTWPPAPAAVNRELVEAAWYAFSAPIRRYLAAKAFASWIPWQGGTIRTGVAALAAARAVLRVEAVRQCREARRALDEALLLEAIRRTDLLLVHQVSAQAMARRLFVVTEAAGSGPV